MDCMKCPKRRYCSGGACYYEEFPEQEPDKEFIEDLYLSDLLEWRETE